MKLRCLLILLAMVVPALGAQPESPELDLGQFADAAKQWAEENIDEEVLRALPEVDREQVEKFLKEFETQLRGDSVVDVARFKDAAMVVLPLLESAEETAPLGAWLRTRLDYFEVAVELQKVSPPVNGQPATNPAPTIERKVWVEQLGTTDWPKGAEELVPKLKSIFVKELVPPELVWLAEVESTFNPKARSPVGAAGLFQLMPPTAKRFGLRSWPFDQRYQPEPSALAAAKYLRLLGKQFGDWRLALAAYNAGEGTVQRLLTKHKATSFDAIATRLPAETQMYVPKVEATILRREGRELPKYPITQIPKKS